MDDLRAAAHDALMQRAKSYKGFVMTWSEPPETSDRRTINIGSDDRRLFAKLGRSSKVVAGATLEEALEKAKRFIDSL
jgi:alkanesulfonate monooxygenase SsuD/methylene tetrahydromethanopterin reductase-like flavin-dependent oxidoreductase (luciferase family)